MSHADNNPAFCELSCKLCEWITDIGYELGGRFSKEYYFPGDKDGVKASVYFDADMRIPEYFTLCMKAYYNRASLNAVVLTIDRNFAGFIRRGFFGYRDAQKVMDWNLFTARKIISEIYRGFCSYFHFVGSDYDKYSLDNFCRDLLSSDKETQERNFRMIIATYSAVLKEWLTLRGDGPFEKSFAAIMGNAVKNELLRADKKEDLFLSGKMADSYQKFARDY